MFFRVGGSLAIAGALGAAVLVPREWIVGRPRAIASHGEFRLATAIYAGDPSHRGGNSSDKVGRWGINQLQMCGDRRA